MQVSTGREAIQLADESIQPEKPFFFLVVTAYRNVVNTERDEKSHFNPSLSTLGQRRVSVDFKSKTSGLSKLGKHSWNTAETRGTRSAGIMISKCTSNSKGRNCRFAGDAGANWQKKTWSGEKMEGFSMNTARSLLGKNVNLHLKDGSVIINVLLSKIDRDEYQRRTFLECVSHGERYVFRVPLKSIAWAERLNLSLILSD
jgi:hypothetical protein